MPDFQFEAIPDSLPDSNEDTTQDITLLCESVRKNFLAPFHTLLAKLNNDAIETSSNPPVTCIVSDGFMSTFTITAAEAIGVPIVLFYTIAACSFMGFKQLRAVVEKGLFPLKGEIYNYELKAIVVSKHANEMFLQLNFICLLQMRAV